MFPIPLPLAMGYAETHFKFKLPWSPLHKNWPEIFIEAPFQMIPQEKAPLWLVIKDAHLWPVSILEIRIIAQNSQTSAQESCTLVFDQHNRFNNAFHFWELEHSLKISEPGLWRINAFIRAQNHKGQIQEIINWNYPHLLPIPLEVVRLRQKPLYPNEYWAGEHHCHSHYTSDPVEFGAHPAVLQKAAKCVGLDYTVITDHSYNFYYDSAEYMRAQPPSIKWNDFLQEIDHLNQKNPQSSLLIPGLEVSCGNTFGQNVHLLIMGLRHFIDGHGDGGRRWFNNKPDHSIEKVLAFAQGLPSFAAHPKAQIGKLEQLVFRRGIWNHIDLSQARLTGHQFWNGHKNKSYWHGKKAWIDQLILGRDILPIGANDAHGDLNRCSAVQLPLFSLKSHRNHIFGKVRTIIHAKSCTETDLTQSFTEKNDLCISDGPWIGASFLNEKIHLKATSQADYGALTQIQFIFKLAQDLKEQSITFKTNTFNWEHTLPIPADITYFRLECKTESQMSALTKATFFKKN